MIYITRPVTETHKTVPKTAEKSLDNNLKENKPKEKITNKEETQKEIHHIKLENLDKAVEEANRVVFKDDNRFEFKIHEGTGRMMVKLVNKETDEIVKEIPPEAILDLVASIWDLVGILVDERG